MTVTIELRPDIEAGLAQAAQRQGMSPADYAGHLIERQLATQQHPAPSSAERAAIWRSIGKDLPPTPPLSDEAISRESIYATRG